MGLPEPQREEQVVSGTIVGIIQKNPDTWQISVMPTGSQYAKNLWTKDEGLVGDASRRIGQAFDFLCGVSHWNRQDGQAVRSLWVNSVVAFGSLAPTEAQQQQPATTTSFPVQQQPARQQAVPAARPPVSVPEDVRETRIMRQTAAKCAVMTMPMLKEEERTLAGIEVMAEWFFRYFVGGPRAPEARSEDPPPPPEGDGGFPHEDQPDIESYDEFPPGY